MSVFNGFMVILIFNLKTKEVTFVGGGITEKRSGSTLQGNGAAESCNGIARSDDTTDTIMDVAETMQSGKNLPREMHHEKKKPAVVQSVKVQ